MQVLIRTLIALEARQIRDEIRKIIKEEGLDVEYDWKENTFASHFISRFQGTEVQFVLNENEITNPEIILIEDKIQENLNYLNIQISRFTKLL